MSVYENNPKMGLSNPKLANSLNINKPGSSNINKLK